ncbi:putative reverse transcriptase domain-containing protein [Tanacetum coccineum]
MTKLTQKKVKFEWGDKQETTFQLIKQKLCSAPILALPEGSEDFIVYCDASKKGLGAVLMQREKKDEYETWAIKMEYWIMNSDRQLVEHCSKMETAGKRQEEIQRKIFMILPPVSVEEHSAVQEREQKQNN